MLEIRDPAIKLFGKTIPVFGDGDESPRVSNDSSDFELQKESGEEDSMETEQTDDLSPPAKEKIPDNNESEKDSEVAEDEKDSNDPKNSGQKPLKKPDKILPCPRCNSMETKFCYYNNYNVNQPRYFCKSCQRYWTAGGTMRNVPVGAGRRKNKSSTSRYCHITVSDALQAAQINSPKTNGTVLTFGSDNPLCESMASALNIGADKKVDGVKNNDGVKKGSQETITQMPCFQWPYMWNPAIPIPAFYPSSFPMSIYPAPYWNVPWVSPCLPGQKSPGSNPSSPTLGKHSRDEETVKPSDSKNGSKTGTVLVPKTLRIDDPDEAAKSSIWTTLGINKENSDFISKGGFFNRFQFKGNEKDHKMEASMELKANPAALCRSITFQESA